MFRTQIRHNSREINRGFRGDRWVFLGFSLFLFVLLMLALWRTFVAPESAELPVHDVALDGGSKPASDIENSALQLIPKTVVENKAAFELGKRLFDDERISLQQDRSCSSCHSLNSTSSLVPEVNGERYSAVSLFNLNLNIAYFHDGRARRLEQVFDDARHREFAQLRPWSEVGKMLHGETTYALLAREALVAGEDQQDWLRSALIYFLEHNASPYSRFDRFLAGELSVLTDAEVKGYSLFLSYGCVSCHQGANVGGNLFQAFGVMVPYVDVGEVSPRVSVDQQRLRVPTLRNVEHTGPYFYNGAVERLDDAVQIMAQVQLARELPSQDVQDIVAFLKTLTVDSTEGLP